jgi:Fibronectin type III domain/Leucine rich repeat
LTYGDSGLNAYEDGTRVNGLSGFVATNTGTGITFGDPAHPLAAALDDARIYNRELSPNEVRGLGFSCANVSQIPRAECQALVDLYLSTDSTHWTNSTGWLANNTPCSWFGVACTDTGHVNLLGLPSNNLSGPIPASLGDLTSLIALVLSGNHLTGSIPDALTGLTALQTLSLRQNALSGGVPSNIGSMAQLAALNLADNQLTGDVSSAITGLHHLTGLDVTDNGIYPTDPAARTFFSFFNPAWLDSQTIPPFDVHTTNVTASGATLTWRPISYTGDGGYYEVLAFDPSTNTSTSVGRTTGKTATGLTVTGLPPGPDYAFAVRTVTPPHGSQQNTVTSEVSDPATPASTAPGAPTITSVTPADGTVTVAFTTPSDGGSPLTGYTVTASPGGATTDGTASPLTVSGLTNGTPYTFTVHATNAVGPGPESTASAQAVPHAATTTVTTQDTSLAVTWGTWSGVTAAAASGGSYRVSRTAGATSSFDFSGTSVTWLVRKGPDRGLARVSIDGVSKGTVDLYAATAGNARLSFGRLSNRTHRLSITVLGAHRPAATGANVTVDGFLVGTSTTPVQETSPTIVFGTWTLTTTSGASAGSFRGSGATGATATFTFIGTRIDWITAYGPDSGRAAVSVDGGPAVTVDLYRRTAAWQVLGRSFTDLGPGSHWITVRVLGTRNSSSRGTRVAVDAFRVTR